MMYAPSTRGGVGVCRLNDEENYDDKFNRTPDYYKILFKDIIIIYSLYIVNGSFKKEVWKKEKKT